MNWKVLKPIIEPLLIIGTIGLVGLLLLALGAVITGPNENNPNIRLVGGLLAAFGGTMAIVPAYIGSIFFYLLVIWLIASPFLLVAYCLDKTYEKLSAVGKERVNNIGYIVRDVIGKAFNLLFRVLSFTPYLILAFIVSVFVFSLVKAFL